MTVGRFFRTRFRSGRAEPSRPVDRSAALGRALFSSCYGHHFRGLIASLSGQVCDARLEIQCHPLAADTDDDPVSF